MPSKRTKKQKELLPLEIKGYVTISDRGLTEAKLIEIKEDSCPIQRAVELCYYADSSFHSSYDEARNHIAYTHTSHTKPKICKITMILEEIVPPIELAHETRCVIINTSLPIPAYWNGTGWCTDINNGTIYPNIETAFLQIKTQGFEEGIIPYPIK